MLTAQTVNKANTSTALTSSANPSKPGQSVTFTATVTVNPPGSTAVAPPTGAVVYFDGSSSIGQGTLTPTGGTTTASFTTSMLSVGSHTITASYTGTTGTGDSNFLSSPPSPPITQTVNQTISPPTVTPPPDPKSTEGQPQSFSLGSFTDPNPNSSPWTVTVAWGDSSPNTTFTAMTQGTLTPQSHTYSEEGTFTVTLTITDSLGATSAPVNFHVGVSDPAVVASPLTFFVAHAGVASTNQVGSVTDPAGAEPNANYLALILWGDNTLSLGTITGSSIFTISWPLGAKPLFPMQPNAVVTTALKNLGRKTTVVSGWLNSIIALSTRLLPRSWNSAIFGWVVRRMLNGAKTPSPVGVEQTQPAFSNNR